MKTAIGYIMIIAACLAPIGGYLLVKWLGDGSGLSVTFSTMMTMSFLAWKGGNLIIEDY